MNPDKLLARAIMLDDYVEWSTQGFGMLRAYLKGANLRLHIWDPAGRVEDVTDVHSHPWDLRSYVIAGSLVNELYAEEPGGATHLRHDLKAGEGGHLVGEPRPVCLEVISAAAVQAGEQYVQAWTAVHRTRPAPYTVTLVERHVPTGNDPDMARTYSPIGQDWVSAEPRPATREEVERAVGGALERYW